MVAYFILTTLSFISATRPSKEHIRNQDLSSSLQTLISNQEQEVMEQESDIGDEDFAQLQGVFAVLEQVDKEKAKKMKTSGAMNLLWGVLGNGLWNRGKSILKKNYCPENSEIRVLIQELIGDKEIPEDTEDGNDRAIAELKALFKVLDKIDTKATQDDHSAKANVRLNDIKDKVKEKIRAITKKYLC